MPDPSKIIQLPQQTKKVADVQGIQTQLIYLEHGGELTVYRTPRLANGTAPIVHPPAAIPPGWLFLAVPPDEARLVLAALQPKVVT